MPDSHYKALLVGNGAFDRDPHKLSPLKGPSNDLRVLRAALTHADFGLFDPNNVRHLLDGTHSEVLEAVETFFTDAGPEDHITVDLASSADIHAAIAVMKEKLTAQGSRLHALVNNAAISPKQTDGSRLSTIKPRASMTGAKKLI